MIKENSKHNIISLEGQCLIATPQLTEDLFQESVVFICSHSTAGAMGLVLNNPMQTIQLSDLLPIITAQVQDTSLLSKQIMCGGPIEMGRAFILHSPDYYHETSIPVGSQAVLSPSFFDVVRVMSQGKGPHDSMLTLGYAGWDAGQLDEEIKQNAWWTIDADPELLFHIPPEKKWRYALKKLGVNPDRFSKKVGLS